MELLAKLTQSRDETLRFFDLSPEYLARTYSPGKWTVQYLLHHLSDAETVLFDRIRRVISKPNQVIWAFDQDAWADGLDYAHRPLVLSKELFAATRAGVLYYAEQCYTSKGHHGFVHSETGRRTLKDEFEKVAWHNEHHLAQIRTAIEH